MFFDMCLTEVQTKHLWPIELYGHHFLVPLYNWTSSEAIFGDHIEVICGEGGGLITLELTSLGIK